MYFKSIEDILNSGILSERISEGFSDNVLKSTRLEREIFRDIRDKTPEIKEFETEGRQYLSSIKQLINDVFQAFYTITPKMLDDEDLSPTAKKVNKIILSCLLTQDEYASRKAVCEGCEMPAMEAAIVFIRNLMPRLNGIAKALSGGDGNMNTMENMAEQCAELHKQLKQEMKKPSPSEKKAVDLANRLKSKREQYAYLQKQADRSANVNRRKLQTVIVSALTQAMDSAETIRFILTSWGNGDMNMPKNEFNTELLERVSKSEKLAYVAKFLGRYKDIYSDKKKNGYEFGRGEVYDITSGNSISRALTSELSLLSDLKTIPVFARKYQNKQLKQYRRREPISKGKGDIIVCLDESYSTYGDNQAWGMAMAMILLQICHDNKRNFALIHFSDKIKTHIFPADDTYMRERMFEASETFLGGNTDFEMPLNKAMDLIQDGDWKDADIVFITDGNCNISKEFENKFKEMQSSHKFTVTGILLDKGKNNEFSLKKFCKKIYRTSEMCKDDIALDIMKDRR